MTSTPRRRDVGTTRVATEASRSAAPVGGARTGACPPRDALERALVVMAGKRDGSGRVVGPRRVEKLRREVLQGRHDESRSAEQAERARARIEAVGLDDMPPPVELVALLVEVVLQRIGSPLQRHAWKAVGVPPRTGEELTSRRPEAVGWPVWFTLERTALGEILPGRPRVSSTGEKVDRHPART